jgi:two-component system, OmpR family, response regulator
VTQRIFLVEDSEIIRENLSATLVELAGAKIVGFASGEAEAIEWIAAHQNAWDLLVIDIFLKQGNGLGVVAFGKSRTAEQRLVVLTNYASPGVRDQCLSLGADAVFDKSNDIEKLIAFCLDKRAALL